MRVLTLTIQIAKQLSGNRPLRVEIPDRDTDYLTENCTRHLSEEAANNITEMIMVEPAPITGWRRLLIKWRLRRMYRAECAAAVLP